MSAIRTALALFTLLSVLHSYAYSEDIRAIKLVSALTPNGNAAPPSGYSLLGELTSSDGTPVNLFGDSIAVSGNTVVIGAPVDVVNGTSYVGAVYVFEKPASGWENMTQVAKLTPSEGEGDIRLGISVAISGDTIVAGAIGISDSGPAYVFVKPEGGWTDMTQTAELSHDDGYTYDGFAISAAISGNTIVVGSSIGAYIYTRPTTGWSNATQTAKLTGQPNNDFGLFVAIQGNTILADNPAGDEGLGSVCVFARPSGGWVNTSAFEAELTASDAAPYSAFGDALAIEGHTIVVGARQALGAGQSPPGAVYVYQEPANGWIAATETAELTVADQTNQELGSSVGVSGGFVIAGAPDARGGGGAAYLFAAPPGGWVNTSTYTKKMGAGHGGLGLSAAIAGTTAFVGAPEQQVGSNVAQGAAYVFGVTGANGATSSY
jgi:hypothetical protein